MYVCNLAMYYILCIYGLLSEINSYIIDTDLGTLKNLINKKGINLKCCLVLVSITN